MGWEVRKEVFWELGISDRGGPVEAGRLPGCQDRDVGRSGLWGRGGVTFHPIPPHPSSIYPSLHPSLHSASVHETQSDQLMIPPTDVSSGQQYTVMGRRRRLGTEGRQEGAELRAER